MVYYPISDAEIGSAEARLGQQFPYQLRTFYREVGYGFFVSHTPQIRDRRYNYINRFLAPSQIVYPLLGNDEECMPGEGFDRGEIPFFEQAIGYTLFFGH